MGTVEDSKLVGFCQYTFLFQTAASVRAGGLV